MFGSAGVRARLDALRGRLDGPVPTPSRSAADATDRLVLAFDRYLARQDEPRRTADQLVRALDVVPQGIVLADPSGEVAFRNRAASGFVDARHSEALVESALSELIDGAVHGHAEDRVLDLYGPPRRVLQLRAVPLEAADGGGGGAFVMVDDVSERHRLDAVRRDFLANISHELKTPIGAVAVLADTLIDEDDPAVIRRLAERIRTEALRMTSTVDDLVELSRIETGDLPEREPVSVEAAVTAAIDRAAAAADVAGVQVSAGDVGAGLSVVGERRQLVSALTNLLDNAVKYSDRGGLVSVAARADGSFVEIEVVDHGIGIPARDLDRIFERFYRVDPARRRETGGTGLGLAIVRHIAQNHGGQVRATSHEGEGSTFLLRLPAGPEGPLAEPSDPSTS